jgi:hypothetical protein
MICPAYTWGSTPEERRTSFACDRHLPGADEAYFRALDVEAPASTVFRWLCQLRVAPYSYDWIDNLGRRSPQTLTPGLDELEVGQRAMTVFEIVGFEPRRHLTLATKPRAAGEFAVTYSVFPRGETASRLVVKVLARYPRGPVGWAARRLLPWGDLVMMRRQLLNLKHLVERGSV